MKLFIILTVVACSYAAKLDRTYLPPPSAATAGGSPGSLNAPIASGPSDIGLAPSGAFGSARQQPGQSGQQNYEQASFGPSNQGPFNKVGPSFAAEQGFGRTNQPARPQASAEQSAEILRYVNENDGEKYHYNFETSNGISAEQRGVATNGVQAQGSFSYTGDDGQSYNVEYTADENGYQPHGDHLPTPPPIPEEILRSIETNAAAAAAGTQEGAYNEAENDSPVSNSQQPSGLSQQYGAQSAGQNNQAPQRNYNNQPSAQSSFSHSGNTPTGFGSSSGPAQPGQAHSSFSKPGSAGFAPSSPAQSNFKSSNTQSGFGPSASGNQFNRPQGFGQQSSQNSFSGQPQDNSGYQYNRPAGSQSPFRAQPSGPSGPSGPAGPAGPAGSSEPFRPSGPSGPSGPYGPFGPSEPSKPARPSAPFGNSASPKRPSSPAQNSFGPKSAPQQPASNNFQPRPSGFNQAASPQYNNQQSAGARSPMSQFQSAPYEYNPPKPNQPSGPFNPLVNQTFNQGSQGSPNTKAPRPNGQDFSGPKQPPSFSEQDGYKY